MNATATMKCECDDNALATHGLAALCDACVAEYIQLTATDGQRQQEQRWAEEAAHAAA